MHASTNYMLNPRSAWRRFLSIAVRVYVFVTKTLKKRSTVSICNRHGDYSAVCLSSSVDAQI